MYSSIDPDVRSGLAAVNKRDDNRFDHQPSHRKIEILIDVEYVHQPISECLDTVERLHFHLRLKTDCKLFYS